MRRIILIVAAMAAANCACAQEPGREIFHSGTLTTTMEPSTVQGDAVEQLTDAAHTWETRLGGIRQAGTPSTKTGANGTFSVVSDQFNNDAKNIVHTFLAAPGSSEVCHVRTSTGFGAMMQLSRAFQACSTALTASAKAGQPGAPDSGAVASTQPARPALPPAGAASRPGAPVAPTQAAVTPGAFQANWNTVEGVYFRSTTGIGYGGMVIIDYIPVVLFKDGTYFEVDKMPLEDTDLAAERARRPNRFGTWTRAGDTFSLQGPKGAPHAMPLQDGNFFRTYTSEEGGPLQGRFSRTGGGGNSAVGGEMGILTQSKYGFTPDGRFTTGSSMAALGSGAQSGVSIAGGAQSRMPGVGSYSLSKNTLTLQYSDGHTERRFFAYGSAHKLAQVDRELIFLGDDVYVGEH